MIHALGSHSLHVHEAVLDECPRAIGHGWTGRWWAQDERPPIRHVRGGVQPGRRSRGQEELGCWSSGVALFAFGVGVHTKELFIEQAEKGPERSACELFGLLDSANLLKPDRV